MATLSEHYAGVLEDLEAGARLAADQAIRDAREKVSPQSALFGHQAER